MTGQLGPRRALSPRPATFARALLVATLALGFLAACRGLRELDYEADPGPYDRLSEEARRSVWEARLGFEQRNAGPEDLAEARDKLLAVRHAWPHNVAVGAMLQDVELAIQLGGEDRGPVFRAAHEAAQRELWRRRADNNPSAAAFVLAARVEDDGPAALHLLERALEEDPRCVWAHYGRAHVLTRSGDWTGAEKAIALALESDPGHLPTRRLQVTLYTRLGDSPLAISALRAWLERAEGDPLIASEALVRARIDLALFLLLDEEESEAREILLAAGDSDLDPVRRLTALAAAEQAMNRPLEALKHSQEAEAVDPAEGLAQVQQALLYELWLDDPLSARMVWERLLAGTEEHPDMGRLFLNLRARVAIERLKSLGEPDFIGLDAPPIRPDDSIQEDAAEDLEPEPRASSGGAAP